MATEKEEGTPRRRPPRQSDRGDSRDRDSNSAAERQPREQSRPERSRPERSHPERSHPELSSTRAAQRAVTQLYELTTREIEAVVGISKKDDGSWNVIIEVVEAHHFPESSDVMAEYSVNVDTEGELLGYSRKKRYLRGRPGE
jgi:hypothetical protein